MLFCGTGVTNAQPRDPRFKRGPVGGKAGEMYKKLEKSNSKLAKQFEKFFKNVESSGSTKKTIENRVKKIQQAAKDIGINAAKATGAKAKVESVKWKNKGFVVRFE